jgi:phage major head subunit gpT-like protein
MALRSSYSDQFLSDALPVLEALIYDEYEKYPDHISDVFQIMPSEAWGEQTTTMGGVIAAPQKNEGENTAQSDPVQGFDKTYTHLTYAVFCSFSEELVEDDRLGLVQKTYRSLGLSMYQTRQTVAFNVLNDGFGDTGPDSANLFATSHTMAGGHTYANRPSTDIALSVAGLREMEVDMARQVNHRNINIMVMPNAVVVPPDLMQTGEELIGSPDRPDTDNRAINTFHRRNYKLVVTPFLSSVTAWFAFAPPDQTEMRFYERSAPKTKTWEDESSGDINTRIRCRFSVSYSDFIGAWGTTG